MLSPAVGLRISLALALMALVIVALAENARIPVDNPATHLELTMVHEAMVLEYSGRHLAMIELAAHLKLLLYISLIACVFVPLGIAPVAGASRRTCRRRASPTSASLLPAACLLALFETTIAKMRVFRVPNFLGAALMLGLLGTLLLLRVARAVMDRPRLRRRAHARRRAGPGQLHAAVSGPAAAAAQRVRRCRPSCSRFPSPGRPISSTRRIFTSPPAIALVFKAIVIPVALHRIVARLGIHREIETVVSIGADHARRHRAGGAVDGGHAARDRQAPTRWRAKTSPSRCRSCCSGLLMMVTRRNAVSQVVGFMSLENGLILAATGAKGMPLVVEISVAFSVLIAFIVIGIFLFRIRERFDTVDVEALDDFRGERR